MSTTGTCLCGAVRVALPEGPLTADVCHCSMCRTITGGSPLFAVHVEGTPAIEGEESVTRYRSSDWAERGFCARCGTSLFYHLLPADEWVISAGIVEAGRLTLGSQIFIDEKPDFYDLANDTPKLTGAEVIALYGGPQESPQ